MRKRGRYENEGKTIGDKIILYTGIGVAIFAVIVIGLLFYSKSLNEEVKKGSLTTEQISDIMNNTSENNESTPKKAVKKKVLVKSTKSGIILFLASAQKLVNSKVFEVFT